MTAALAMRAVVHDGYGPPDVLRLEDVARPIPASDEVLGGAHAEFISVPESGPLGDIRGQFWSSSGNER